MTVPTEPEFDYDVAISFAGENRDLAKQLFEILKSKGVKVFYDANEQANLWGRDLYQYFSEVYLNRARYCLMIVSEYYQLKSGLSWNVRVPKQERLAKLKSIFYPFG